MRAILTLHRAPPGSATAATREFEFDQASLAAPDALLDDPQSFLAAALARMADGIAPGELREVGIGVSLVG